MPPVMPILFGVILVGVFNEEIHLLWIDAQLTDALGHFLELDLVFLIVQLHEFFISDEHMEVLGLDIEVFTETYMEGDLYLGWEGSESFIGWEVDAFYGHLHRLLGVDVNASDEEVKKAYREMAKKNHPDLVSNLGEEVRQAAEKKFQEVNSAYEAIKKQRGM